jgi:cytochrome c-type biogenesis protein CcmH/NrfF
MTGISRKTMIPRLIQLLLLALLPALVLAETAEKQQARVERLEHAVLAPCCYTEPVAIHQSEIAVKMRLEIAKWVAAGRSDREIIDTYVGLYGSKVLE